MTKGKFWGLALLLFVAGTTAYGQNFYYLPQVANGGGFRTTFVFFNNHDTSAIVVLSLTNDNGEDMNVTIPGLGTDNSFFVTLDPGATRIYQTDGVGSISAGAATVTSTAPIGVSAIFTIYDGNGNFTTESGVGSSQPLTNFVIPVDATGTFNTGLALFNPNGDTANITAILSDTNGTEVARTNLPPLNGGAHKAVFVAGPGQMFPNVSNFQGTLNIQSSVSVSALTLRQNSAPLSYTSLPAVSKTSTQTSLTLPQVANGSFSGGSFKTSFLIFSTSSSTANVTLTLTDDNGAAFPVTIQGQGTNSTFNFAVPAGKAFFLQTDGTGPLTAGAARIASSAPVGAAAIFTVYDPQGRFQTESGVGDSAVQTQMTLPVDITGSFDTGVAFFNPSSSTTTLTLRLMNTSGANVGTAATVTLGPNGHRAAFVSQLFPGTSNFQGSLAISSPTGAAALTLRQNSSPLSYTTLPVASGVAQGTTQVTGVLLSQTQTGVNATSNTVVNQTLPAGFKLSGTIQGGFGFLVTAQSGTSTYSGSIDLLSGKYALAVAAGTYTLRVTFIPNPSVSGFIVYTDPSPVQVSGDTTRNITLSAPTLFNISGSVSGLSNIPSSQSAPSIVFVSADGLAEGLFELTGGAFQGSLPAGNYTASIAASQVPTGGTTETLSLFNLGSVTVSGNTTASFAVPALATLSGTVTTPGITLPSGATVGATDTSATQPTAASLIFAPSSSTVHSSSSGAYQMLLQPNRTYGMSVSFAPSQGTTVYFPVTTSTVNLSGNSTYNFSLPSLPGPVTISGKVTDGSGTGVANVSVSAFTQSLTGAADTMAAGGGTTDAGGNYTFPVLGGSNYTVTFSPKSPTP